MAHPNETLVREAFAAFSRGDLEWLRNEVFSENVTYHIPGQNVISGDYEGVDAVLAFFVRLAEETGGTFSLEFVDVLANDERVVVLYNSSATRGGETLEMTELVLFAMSEGKVTEAWPHPRDQYALDALWA